MIVGVPRETFPGERRVALVPAVLPTLAKAGLQVVVEAGAGVEAGYLDADYLAKGAKILPDRAEVFRAGENRHPCEHCYHATRRRNSCIESGAGGRLQSA